MTVGVATTPGCDVGATTSTTSGHMTVGVAAALCLDTTRADATLLFSTTCASSHSAGGAFPGHSSAWLLLHFRATRS